MNLFKYLNEPMSMIYHAVTGAPTASQMRQQSNLINEQINAYKSQTQMAQDQLNATRDMQTAEKRRIEEKQIKALRRSFRPAGFLDTPDDSMTNKLGA